ncbi:UDP-glucuronosyltransferase 2C1-like [Eucyclogobius newberryi]|uniref:UDP-glucuronosyltransferase 2C1-like n=1 Tax=Eucyclogobius newberryi TaxID=166745 RepID=UPI003B5B634E
MRSLVLSAVSAQVLFLALALVQVGPALGGKVLVFPGEFSHWLNMKSLIQELRRRDHSISIMVPTASPSVKYNDTELKKDFNFIVFEVPYTVADYKEFLEEFMHFSMYESHKASVWTKVRLVNSWLGRSVVMQTQNCEGMVRNAEVMAQLRAANFDLVLWDPMTPCGDLMARLLDLPLVISLRFSFGGVMERHCGHAPLPPSYVPASPLTYSDSMTFTQRLTNVLTNLLSSAVSEVFWKLTLDNYYSDVLGQSTTVCDTMGRADMWLIRTYWDIETPRPLPPNFHYVGGLHCKPANPLPEDLEEFVSSSEAGVVVVTFGSMVNNLTTERAEVIATALAQIPQKVVWRYSGSTPRSLGPNTKLLHWIPQNDLLGHPRTRAFVAHGGTNGLYEALFHAVPLVGVPLFGDQSDNLARLSRRGGAVVLDFNTMTSQEMTSAINEVVDNPSFRQSMLRASAVHRDRPLPALQEAAFWVEFVLRNGASHLRLASRDLGWLQYHSLDVAAFLLLVTATAIAVTATVARKMLRLGLGLVRGSRPHQD